MSKTRDTGYLANVIQVHDTGVRIMSGSTMLMAISSSGAVTITGELSGSDAANSLLLSGTGSVGFTTTGSFSTASGSASSRLTQIEAVYATTGSNSFRATQSITGSLTVTGQIIAQTINVQQVTSSIIYSSGSNVFGCDLNSRQTFTGSLFVTGSNVNINSTGIGIGTLPSSKLHVCGGSVYISNNPGTDGFVFGSASSFVKYSYITSTNDGAQKVGLSFNTTCDAGTTNQERLKILSDTGVACFSNAVCAPQFIGGTICGTGGFSMRGATTTWSTTSFLPDNSGGAGAQCKTVLAATIIGCTGWGPQLRFSGATAGQFIDIGQDCNGGFVVEGTDNPRLTVTNCGCVGIGTCAPSVLLHVSTDVANDNSGHIQYENTCVSAGAASNAQLIGKSRFGTAQLMVWENLGIRFGMRSTANGGAGDIHFTTGTDTVTLRMINGGISCFAGRICVPNISIGTSASIGTSFSVGAIGHYTNYISTSGCFAIFCASQGAILYVTSMHNNGRATYQLIYSNGPTGGASISVVGSTSAYGPASTSFGLCANGWVYGYQQYGGPTDFYAIAMNSNFVWAF